jgi:hypothetical protein
MASATRVLCAGRRIIAAAPHIFCTTRCTRPFLDPGPYNWHIFATAVIVSAPRSQLYGWAFVVTAQSEVPSTRCVIFDGNGYER